MATVKEYFELTKKYKMDYGDKTIVLYQVGSFFEVYAMVNADATYSGSNIAEFSTINDMTIADKHTTYENKPVVMAGVGVAYIDKYLERLQEHGYTIVIYKQDSTSSSSSTSTSSSTSKNTTRSLSEIISPGTFFPVESDNDVLSNNIMCIWIHKTQKTKRNPQVQVILGIATIDIYTGKTSLFQFTADYIHSPTTYDELDRYISAYTPSECLFVANMPESLIDDIIGFVGLEGKKIHKISTATPTPSGANISPKRGLESTPPQHTNGGLESTPPKHTKGGLESTPPQHTKGGLESTPPKHTKGGLGGAAPQAEKQIYQQEVLKRFFPRLSVMSADMFPTYYIATQSFVFLLDFVYQHNPNLVTRLTEPLFENYTDRLSLANHSLSQLNITDDSRHTGKMRSVGSFLNNCMTTMGKRNFLYQLHYPTTNEFTLQAAYDITEHLLQNGTWQSIRTALSTITDLEKFVRKVVNRKSVPKDLSTVVEDLKVIEQLFIESKKDATLMDYLEKEKEKSIAVVCRAIIEDIATTFNLEECRKTTDITDASSIINRGVSKTLDMLTRDSLDGQDKLEAICAFLSGLVKSSMEKEKEAKYVKIHETAKSAAVLLATSRRAVLLKEAVKKMGKSAAVSYASRYSGLIETFDLDLSALEYTTGGGSKNDVVITSPQIRAITSQNEESKEKRIREMQLIFQNYIVEFIKFQTDLQHCIKYATEMDLLQNKCYVAHKYNYCKPTLDSTKPKSFFSFTGIRHPLIEHIQTQELYVTNDLALGACEIAACEAAAAHTSPYFNKKSSDTQGTSSPWGADAPQTPHNQGTSSSERGVLGGFPPPRGVLLYGTNAVGKTSFIKSIGIAVVMAQAGLYVPCSSFTFKPYQSIFTRILGNDNLFKGLSTFAVEMTELRSILTMADKHSLVLGDELCSGTESDSALSIFTAGLEILHEKECTFLFATHFHEINTYDEIKALSRLKMMHMAVHYNRATNALVYDRKLRDGSGDSMYGLEVCKSLHLPEAFLNRAHDIRMKYHKEQQPMLSYLPSHFNARKLVGNCELCQAKKASEVHHLQHQKNANDSNHYIETFHKNHVANLLNICEECHHKIHTSGQQHRVVKTTAGYSLEQI